MSPRRGDNPIRASANSVMRKLSMTSIAGNFSKRSISHANDGHASPVGSNRTLRGRQVSDGKKHPVLVDLHTAPNALLPEGSELNTKPNRRARKASVRFYVHNTARATSETRMPGATTENLVIQTSKASNCVAKPTMRKVDGEDEKAGVESRKSSEVRAESPMWRADLDEKRPGSAGSAARTLVMTRGLFRLFG